MTMKFVAVGDNVTDCYLDQKIFYPGGNAVNVVVNCKRNGFDEAAYIGVFGDDINANHIKYSLDQEHIIYDRSRTIYGPSGQPGVNLVNGDRVFVPSRKDTAQHILRLCMTPADLDYISGFDICHTSCYSSIEPELPVIAKACKVSFDFSDRTDNDEYLKTVCPHSHYAFFSGSHLTEEAVCKLMDRCHELGTPVVGVTRGGEGAFFSKEGQRYRQGIVPTDVVDTMGAGDSFIAGFLTETSRGGSMEKALQYAAQRAANTCTFYGGFGYPHPFSG